MTDLKAYLYTCWVFALISIFNKGNWEAFIAASFVISAIIDQNKRKI